MARKLRITFSSFLLLLFNFYYILNCQAQIKPEVIHPEWSRNVVIYEANIRQYTPEGTFKEFEKHLPELQKMGIGIIWLMPINPIGVVNRKGSLGSYYSVKDYKAVNPEFGTLDDLKHLVKQIHKMKMHVIIDWVANHTSWDNTWTKTHPDFYNKDSLGKFYSPNPDWTDVIDLNYNNKELWKYMIDAMGYWVKQCDIDGFRCDVAAMVPTKFWIDARKQLLKIKHVFMLAEASENYLHQAFDMTYNRQLKDLMNEIAHGKKKAVDIIKLFNEQNKVYAPDDYRMVFTSNHDENSWHGTVYEKLDKGAETFAVLCGIVKGMPLIYSGQEAGLKKRLRFFDKDTIEWEPDPMREIYSKLDLLKEKNHALWNGTAGGEMTFLESGNEDVLAFVREKDDYKVLAVFNLSPNQNNIDLKDKLIKGSYSYLYDDKTKTDFSDEIKIQLEPWSYKVYIK
jgi:cyclomaltodextrinase